MSTDQRTQKPDFLSNMAELREVTVEASPLSTIAYSLRTVILLLKKKRIHDTGVKKIYIRGREGDSKLCMIDAKRITYM